MAQKTLTLYLAKPDVLDFDDILSEGGKGRLVHRNTRIANSNEFGDGARVYIFVGDEHPPKWLTDLRAFFDIRERIEACSACALLAFRAGGRIFPSPLAHGWMYLEGDNIEGDFGLRVALNTLNDKKLRRLERANLADALRGVSHSPFQREFTSFGLDDALDLLRKVSGKTNDDASADSVTGAKSLKLSGEFGLEDLPALAAEALEAFASTAYQDTSFKIIDFVQPVVDGRLIRTLDAVAAERIRSGADDFELSLPETGEDETVGYCFVGANVRGQHADLLLRDYITALGDQLAQVTPDILRCHKVRAVYGDGKPDRNWSIRSALVGSVVHENGRYAINEGEWYRLDDAFKRSIEKNFEALRDVWIDRPIPLRRLYDQSGRKEKFQSEASYNAELAAALGFCLLDTKTVEIAGIQRSGFEPCDLLDVEGKRFIHVKKSSRRSNILSHFFKQGSNAAQQFSKFPTAWAALRALVVRECGDDQGERLDAVRADDRPWTVEFLILDAPRVNGEFNIPFFSKISLRDEVINLRAMHYEVAVRFIGH